MSAPDRVRLPGNMQPITTTENSRKSARAWRGIPSSRSTPSSCARPPITRCCAWRRSPRPTRPSWSMRWRPASILAPFFDLLTDEKVVKVFHAARQDIEIVWNMAKKIPHPIFDSQVAAMVLGYGDFDLLRPTGAAHHRRPARQVAPLHRLDAAAAHRRANDLRAVRRDASARRLSQARRRSRQARPRELGRGRDGRAHLARNLSRRAGAGLGAAEEPRAQAERARRADRGRRLARARGADPRRAALARAQGRRDRRHRGAGADHDRAARPIALVAQRLRALALGRGHRRCHQARHRARSQDAAAARALPSGAERRRHRRTA